VAWSGGRQSAPLATVGEKGRVEVFPPQQRCCRPGRPQQARDRGGVDPVGRPFAAQHIEGCLEASRIGQKNGSLRCCTSGWGPCSMDRNGFGSGPRPSSPPAAFQTIFSWKDLPGVAPNRLWNRVLMSLRH